MKFNYIKKDMGVNIAMIRVLHIMSSLFVGGTEQYVMNCFRAINQELIKFDFCILNETIGKYETEVMKKGAAIYHLIPFSRNPIKNLLQYKSLIKKEKYDVIEIHSSTSTRYFYAYIAKKYRVKKVIYHAHNTSDTPASLVERYCSSRIPRYCNQLIACSKKAGDYIYRGNTEFHIIKNAVDLKKYAYSQTIREEKREELGIEKTTLAIGAVGRLNRQKNLLFLIEVLEDILKSREDCRLLLIGDGELRKEIEEVAKEKGIDRKILITGMVEDVHKYMQALDVFVMPSLYEGLPFAGIEAQAAGLPCIFSDTITEELHIAPNIIFLPIDKGTPLWKKAILEMEKIGRADAMRELIQSGYDLETQIDDIIKAYTSSER